MENTTCHLEKVCVISLFSVFILTVQAPTSHLGCFVKNYDAQRLVVTQNPGNYRGGERHYFDVSVLDLCK